MTSLNKFEVDFDNCGVVGEGEHSVVYKVRSRTNGAFYAVKRLKRRLRGVKDRAKGLDEVKRLKQISGGQTGLETYVVKYHDSWEEQGSLYIRTELCKGSLKQLVSSHLPEAEIWRLLTDIGRGLRLIHSYNCVHMDLSPNNILVSDCYKLSDFGHMLEDGAEVVEEGDEAYLAPEVMSGGVACAASDIFSLGLICFELATSVVLPRYGSLWSSLRHGHLPLEKAEISEGLKSVIARMTHYSPDQRITSSELAELPFNSTPQFKYSYASAPPTYEIRELAEETKSEVSVNLMSVFSTFN
jgi:serine/threonine protein kinase